MSGLVIDRAARAGGRIFVGARNSARPISLSAMFVLGLVLAPAFGGAHGAELRVAGVGIEAASHWSELEALLGERATVTPVGSTITRETLQGADVILLAPRAAAGLESSGESAVQAISDAVARGCGLVVTGASADALAGSVALDSLLARAPIPKEKESAGAREHRSVAVLVRDQSHAITQNVTHLVLENVRSARASTALLAGKALAYGMDSAPDAAGQPAPAPGPAPVFWTHQIKAARIAVLTLEPIADQKTPDQATSRDRAAIALLVARSLEWASGRQVTVKVPPEMPLFAERISDAAEGRFTVFPEAVGYFRGREIAPVMGFQAADWLERNDREETEQPERVLDALAIPEGSSVADIGAGTGYFTFRMARRVGASGKVFATDLQEEMLVLLKARMEKDGVKNVVPVQAKETETGLKDDSIDLAIMVDVYHELSKPGAAIEALRRSLRAGKEGVRPGRLVLVEYRGEDPAVPIKPLHRTTVQQVKAELEPRGFRLAQAHEFLPHQHVLVFERRELLANETK